MSPPIILPTRSRRFGPRRLLGRGLGGAANPVAVEFDGTNDFLYKASLSMPTDSAVVMSFWVYRHSGLGVYNYLQSADTWTDGHIRYSNGDLCLTLHNNSEGSYNANNNPTVTMDVWEHYLLSAYNLKNDNTGKLRIYMNDVQSTSKNVLSTQDINNGFDLWSEIAIGCIGTTHVTRWNGYMCEIFMGSHSGEFDLDIEANRRKFRTADGKPANLGADGSLPLGVQPEVYLTGASADTWDNVGSLGPFTINGVLTEAPSSPYD